MTGCYSHKYLKSQVRADDRVFAEPNNDHTTALKTLPMCWWQKRNAERENVLLMACRWIQTPSGTEGGPGLQPVKTQGPDPEYG